MEYSRLVNGGIAQLMPYHMGKPLELIKEEIGARNLIRLNAAESAYGVSPKVLAVYNKYHDHISFYPDASGYHLKHKLRLIYGYDVDCICLGADTQELLSLLARAFLNEKVNVIVPQLSSIQIERVVQLSGAQLITTPILNDWTANFNAILDNINDRTRMVMLANPSNPIGAFSMYSEFEQLLERLPPEVIVVVDEELIDFIGYGYKDLYGLIEKFQNLVVLRSFSHAFGLASLRIGYMLSGNEINGIINTLRDPYNVSQLAQECAIAALSDLKFISRVVASYDSERIRYKEFCSYYNLTMIDTRSCSVCIDFGAFADRYYRDLLALGVFTRPLAYLGLPTLVNISLGNGYQNDYVLQKLEKFMIMPRSQQVANAKLNPRSSLT